MRLTKYVGDAILCNHVGNSLTESMQRNEQRALAGESNIKDYFLPPIPPEFM
ncbi:hypothetical protein HY641_00170 [Candidatus Woesearchaeota archaeon]|nr:hypothetical protein [Candidatus Woesearchaeota archaeon]